MAGRLAGKTVAITGAASGIGAETARLFAGEGARVAVLDIDEAGARAVAGGIGERGGRAQAVAVDVADAQAFEAALDGLAQEHGRLDALVCCAFRMVAGPLETFSVEDWHRCMEVTLHGTFHGVRAALRIMREGGGGSIVCFSSLCGQFGAASMGGYGAAKAAVENLVRTAAAEAGEHGIRVNAVAPGSVATEGTRSVYPDGSPQRRAMEALIPTGRLMEPEQVAEAALFLASDAASGVSGQVLNVDGAQSAALGAPELETGWDR